MLEILRSMWSLVGVEDVLASQQACGTAHDQVVASGLRKVVDTVRALRSSQPFTQLGVQSSPTLFVSSHGPRALLAKL